MGLDWNGSKSGKILEERQAVTILPIPASVLTLYLPLDLDIERVQTIVTTRSNDNNQSRSDETKLWIAPESVDSAKK
jgi:hypothetical protein